MARKDEYYNRSKQEGYRSRAAYKLKQLDEDAHLIEKGDTVVDLGAAPGGWLQVAREKVGDSGTVIGVDFQRIDPVEGVRLVRGDMTEEDTREEVRDIAGEDVSESGDSEAPKTKASGVDVVISDMAPNMTGEYSLDQARSVYLAQMAFETALDVLKPGGDFLVKVFEGRDVDDLRASMGEEFEYVRATSPDASRDESSEIYLIAKGRMTAPVEVGDTRTVTIDDVGDEGDGIAKIETYTVFVPDAERGETVDIEITDVKPRFGFAKRVD